MARQSDESNQRTPPRPTPLRRWQRRPREPLYLTNNFHPSLIRFRFRNFCGRSPITARNAGVAARRAGGVLVLDRDAPRYAAIPHPRPPGIALLTQLLPFGRSSSAMPKPCKSDAQRH